MYCTHCLRIAHIGKKDKMFSKEAYGEALAIYPQQHNHIRDVLVTGGDAFVLSKPMLRWLLEELDTIEHVKMKRLGTRVPVTVPMRIDAELLDILEQSNDRKPCGWSPRSTRPRKLPRFPVRHLRRYPKG